MTALTIYADDDPTRPLGRYTDAATIVERLLPLGVQYEHWELDRALPEPAGQSEVLAAYRAEITRLNEAHGFVTVDVVSMTPDAPNAPESRAKFLAEHTHDDFETRFFVEGSGAFYIRAGGKVYVLVCTKGDLINLPAHTSHWFDMGERPNFKAIRFFRQAEGWVGQFTGDSIADRFPKYEAYS
jgi:1,2-dihydroxy-3-keto-5-methylthiopentene dioxygenase